MVSNSIPGESGPRLRCRSVEQRSQATCTWSAGKRGRPAVPGDSGPDPRDHGEIMLSQATPDWLRGPAVLASKSLRGRPAVPGDWGPGPITLGVDQLSRGTRVPVRGPAGSTSSPGGLALVSEGPRGLPAITATRALVRAPAGLINCPGCIGPVSECARCRPRSRETRDLVRGSAWSTRHSGDSGPCLRLHGFNQHPEPLWTVLGAAVLNSCPRELALGPRVPGVDQRSRATPVRVGWPTVSTSSPGTHARV